MTDRGRAKRSADVVIDAKIWHCRKGFTVRHHCERGTPGVGWIGPRGRSNCVISKVWRSRVQAARRDETHSSGVAAARNAVDTPRDRLVRVARNNCRVLLSSADRD